MAAFTPGNMARSWVAGAALFVGALGACGAPGGQARVAPVVTRPSASVASTAPRVAATVSASSAPRAAKAPRAGEAPLLPFRPHAPRTLAPLGPYAAWPVTLPVECAAPHVLAASAPAKMLERADWFWPWVVQAIVAHDHSFQLVASLGAEDATSRAVQLTELVVPGKAGKSTLSLDVRCKDAATCTDVARVLAVVVPGSRPELGCSLPAGEATTRAAAVDKDQLLPSAQPDEPLRDVASACTRLSVCERHEDEAADATLGLRCQTAPSKFPLRCAAQYTCYDVARCAQAKTSAAPVFSPFADMMGQVMNRGERVGAGQAVADTMGGGGLDPASISMCASFDPNVGPGTWAALLLYFEASNRSPEGYYQEGTGTWAPAFIDWNGSTRLGPGQSVTATNYNAVGLPSDPTEEFDFDHDGVPEVLMLVASSEHASSGTLEYRIFSNSGGAVHAYAPAGSLPIVGFTDFDDDGRLDLLIDTEQDLDETGNHSSRRPEAWALAHTLPDGTFSTTDAVARRYRGR